MDNNRKLFNIIQQFNWINFCSVSKSTGIGTIDQFLKN